MTGAKGLPRHLLAGFLALVAAPAMAQEVMPIVIEKYRFEPHTVTVKAGTVVEWLNAEKRTSHSVIVAGQEESERLFPGERFRLRFDRPGRYAYRCGPHPDMVGTVETVP